MLFGENIDDMFGKAYRPVWESIKSYYNQYHTMPAIETVQERFPLLDEVPVQGDTRYYVDGLRNEFLEGAISNILQGSGKDLSADSAPVILNKLQEKLSALNRFSAGSKDMNIMDTDEAERHYEEVRKAAEASGGTPGIPTGIAFVDSAYPTGFAGGDLVLLFGWTGRGKSQLSTLFSCNAHDLGYKPMIVSLEMSGAKVRDRVYTIKGSGLFKNSSLSLGDISVDDFRSFKAKQEHLPEFIVVENSGIADLNANILQAKVEQYRPSMLTFDYAQLGSDNANSADMTARMRNMSREFKQLAMRNNIPVVLISSATPESSASVKEPPIIEQVAWSKQLAFDADLAFAVHKHDDSNDIEVVCRKNRNGPLFSGFLDWDIDNGIITEVF